MVANLWIYHYLKVWRFLNFLRCMKGVRAGFTLFAREFKAYKPEKVNGETFALVEVAGWSVRPAVGPLVSATHALKDYNYI